MTLFCVLCRGGRCLPQDPFSAAIPRIKLKEARVTKAAARRECRDLRISRSAMPPAVDDEPLEPHEGAHLDDQGHPGESVRYKNSHTVDAFQAVRVVGLTGNATVPYDDIFKKHRPAVVEGIRFGLGAKCQLENGRPSLTTCSSGSESGCTCPSAFPCLRALPRGRGSAARCGEGCPGSAGRLGCGRLRGR